MFRKVILVVFLLVFSSVIWAQDWDENDVPDTSETLITTVNEIDSIPAIQIFVIFPEDTLIYGSDTLHQNLAIYGDTNSYGPSQILFRSSFGKLYLKLDVDPGLNGKYFVMPHSRSWYYANYNTVPSYGEHIKHMNYDIVEIMDSLIDFGDYDSDQDGYVDYMAINYDTLYVNDGWIGYGRLYFPNSSIYQTNDTLANGNPVSLYATQGHIERTHNWDKWFYSIEDQWHDLAASCFTHEFAHNVPILNSGIHSWGYFPNGYQFHASAFDAEFLIYPDDLDDLRRRCSYFTPFWALRTGWLTEDEIDVLDGPVYKDTLRDYITTGDLVEVKRGSNQSFLIANRQALSTTMNELMWPSKGLFIYHIDNTTFSQINGYHKAEDLETADGLFVVNSDYTEMTASSNRGFDELDFKYSFETDESLSDSLIEYLINFTGANYGDSGDAFLPSLDIVFDHTTNPNSNLYSLYGNLWYQNVPSHFSIRNLEQDPNDTTRLIMDILVNHWYDSLTATTVWGDSTKETGYAITGDFIIPAGDTLTIRKGTKIYFQADEDDKQNGYTQTLSEFIVYGTLIVEGDSASHVEFIPSSEQLGTAEAGDWYGIRFMAGSFGSLDYCNIQFARYGIYMYPNSTVQVDDCSFEDCFTLGIYNYRGILTANNDTFSETGSFGIAAMGAQSTIDSCTFDEANYGIYSNAAANDSLDGSVISYCQIANCSNYGIRVGYDDDFTIVNNAIRDCSQAGIYLINSDPIVKHDTIKTTSYGIYLSGSKADIDSCMFDSLSTGIYCGETVSPTINACCYKNTKTGVYLSSSSATPNLGYYGAGISTGYNDFEKCSDYFIYQNTILGPTISAEMNYFGSTFSTSKFFGAIDYTPYLTTDPFLKQLDPGELPSYYNLSGNYPNPFNPTTNISFSLAEAGYTTIEIFNVLGQKINTLVDEYMQAGEHTVIWNGTNGAGQQVSSGVYFYKITSGDFTETKKMALLR